MRHMKDKIPRVARARAYTGREGVPARHAVDWDHCGSSWQQAEAVGKTTDDEHVQWPAKHPRHRYIPLCVRPVILYQMATWVLMMPVLELRSCVVSGALQLQLRYRESLHPTLSMCSPCRGQELGSRRLSWHWAA